MNRKTVVTTLVFALITLFGGWYYYHYRQEQLYCKQIFKHQFIVEQANSLLGFDLVDPQQAPPEIRASVMRGYHLVLNTQFHAPEYSKNHLSCTNCHLCGGDTIGGKNGGISLVGVTTHYPQFSKRDNKEIDLKYRIHNCFQRSMNGVAPPDDSQIMNDIVTYLEWISKEVEHVEDIPWLGLKPLKSKHTPDAKAGEKLYQNYCVACHQANGEGGGDLGIVEGKTIPPLWGDYSFNDGAGMNMIRMLAPFIYDNMPYQQASLTEEQALDIAAFIIEQPRPKFVPPPK